MFLTSLKLMHNRKLTLYQLIDSFLQTRKYLLVKIQLIITAVYSEIIGFALNLSGVYRSMQVLILKKFMNNK